MPSAFELIGLLIAVLAVWFVLKLAKVAIKVTLFFILVAVLAGFFYFLFLR
jgi:hypothetical protein